MKSLFLALALVGACPSNNTVDPAIATMQHPPLQECEVLGIEIFPKEVTVQPGETVQFYAYVTTTCGSYWVPNPPPTP